MTNFQKFGESKGKSHRFTPLTPICHSIFSKEGGKLHLVVNIEYYSA